MLFSVGLLAGYYGVANPRDKWAPLNSGVQAGRTLLALGAIGRMLMTPRLSRILVSTVGRTVWKSG